MKKTAKSLSLIVLALVICGHLLSKPVLAQSPTLSKVKKLTKILNTPAQLAGASVTATSGATLSVTQEGNNYTIKTSANTKFRRRYWGKSAFSEISVGDSVNIWGKWADEGKTSINARLVRDLSIQKRQGVFLGTVNSKSDNGFVLLTKNRGTPTVAIDKKTKIYNKRGTLITFNNISVNDKVKVRGLWDNKLNTITEVVKVIDYNLPPIPATPTPKK